MELKTEETRRERILKEVKRRLCEMTEGQPRSDPYRTTFGFVSRGGPLEGIHKKGHKYACTILDTDESKDEKIGQYDVALRVTVEFSAWVDEGEEPSPVLNRILGDVQRKLREDVKLTEPEDPDDVKDVFHRQLSHNVTEVGSQLFIDGVSDKQVTGMVAFLVTYKHAENDPRLYVPQA